MEEQAKYVTEQRGFLPVKKEFLKSFKSRSDVITPLRTTKYSAGYDFFASNDITILPGEQVLFWTDVKAYMLEDEVLKIYPRSSIGIKKNLMLSNTVGCIDSDYFSNEKNDGNIVICLFNYGEKIELINQGDGIAQGIFEKYLIADNCNSDNNRTGGIGSTNG